MIFRAVVFTFIPTAIELALVSWLLAKSFSPGVAGLVIATFVAYVAWTALMTKVLHDPPPMVLVLSFCLCEQLRNFASAYAKVRGD